MSWRDLLQKPEVLTFPWVGGRYLRTNEQMWQLFGKLPAEYGWYQFDVGNNREASFFDLHHQCDPAPHVLHHTLTGYLVGDRLLPDGVAVDPDPSRLIEQSYPIALLEPLDRFSRIKAGRLCEKCPLVYMNQEMPLGPEADVLTAFLDKEKSVDNIKAITPALDAAFRMESWRRAEGEKRRLELERKRREEEARLEAERKHRELVEKLGDGAGRRAMAKLDFAEAARAALAISGAEYLDHRPSRNNEMVVTFRLQRRRFECVCDANTLQVIDSGICLNAHYNDPDFEEGTKGDSWFTLESLPAVVGEAMRLGKLVIFRHAE